MSPEFRALQVGYEQMRERALAAERARDEAVAVLRALVDRLTGVHESAKYEAVWVFWHSHHGPYTGPTYVDELDRARAVLEGGE